MDAKKALESQLPWVTLHVRGEGKGDFNVDVEDVVHELRTSEGTRRILDLFHRSQDQPEDGMFEYTSRVQALHQSSILCGVGVVPCPVRLRRGWPLDSAAEGVPAVACTRFRVLGSDLRPSQASLPSLRGQ